MLFQEQPAVAQAVNSPTGTDRGSDYHSIEVRVKREGLTILTREGYYSGVVSR
jgi:hypothetical protein